MYGPYPTPIVLPCGCSASHHCAQAQRLADRAVAALAETIAESPPSREPAARRAVRGRYYAHRGELVPPSVRAAFEQGPVRPVAGDAGEAILAPNPRVRLIACSACGEIEEIEVGRRMCRACRSLRRREAKVAAARRKAAAVERAA